MTDVKHGYACKQTCDHALRYLSIWKYIHVAVTMTSPSLKPNNHSLKNIQAMLIQYSPSLKLYMFIEVSKLTMRWHINIWNHYQWTDARFYVGTRWCTLIVREQINYSLGNNWTKVIKELNVSGIQGHIPGICTVYHSHRIHSMQNATLPHVCRLYCVPQSLPVSLCCSLVVRSPWQCQTCDLHLNALRWHTETQRCDINDSVMPFGTRLSKQINLTTLK